MLGKKKKLISCLVIFTLLLSTTTAYAATKYWGSSTSYTAGSNKARHASYMYVAGSTIAARTIILNDTHESLPPGWLGVCPIAYYANGNVAERGDGWTYTDSRTAGYDLGAYVSNYKGYLYSKGMTALWNGNGYTRRETTPSPNAKAESSRSAIEGIQVNSSGETFGSTLFITNFEDRPDLIAATGVDGTEGYVRKTDFDDDMPSSPEEAVRLMKSGELNRVRYIPLYDSEGKTVIGKFRIGSPRDEDTEVFVEDGIAKVIKKGEPRTLSAEEKKWLNER